MLLSFCKELVLEKDFLIKPILYTTTDEQCILISKNRFNYEEMFDLCLPSNEIINGYTQKGYAEQLVEKHGILIPKSSVIASFEDSTNIINTFSFPVIVKPVSSKVNVGYKFKILDKASFENMFQDVTLSNGDVLCQEYVPGKDESYKFYIFYRDVDGNITECMGNKTLQTNGIMTIGTTEKDIELSIMCKKFLNSINYVGIGGLEFKKYQNAYYFIEMSTRPEGFLPIADMADVSLSVASYESMNGNYKGFNKKQRENIQYVVLLSILIGYFKKRKFFLLLESVLKYCGKKNIFCVECFIDYRCYWKSIKYQLLRLNCISNG